MNIKHILIAFFAGVVFCGIVGYFIHSKSTKNYELKITEFEHREAEREIYRDSLTADTRKKYDSIEKLKKQDSILFKKEIDVLKIHSNMRRSGISDRELDTMFRSVLKRGRKRFN